MGADSDCSGDSLDDGPDDPLALDDAETLFRGLAEGETLG